jgi:hypothetical protein
MVLLPGDELAASDQTAPADKLAAAASFNPALLRGQWKIRFGAAKPALRVIGALSPPTASATGRTLPPASKKEAVCFSTGSLGSRDQFVGDFK